MKKTNLLILVMFICCLSFSQTHVSGTIVGQTWTEAGSPYIVDSAIFVASLTINPGVTVLFSGNHKFEIGGVLTAIGAPCDSIIFTQADSLSGWGGIHFNFSAPGSEMAYCIIENSRNHGVIIENSTPIIRNCCIQNNQFVKNGTAIGGGVYGIGNITLTDCLIRNNKAHAAGSYNVPQYAYGGGVYVKGTLNLIRCTISGNNAKASANWSTGRAYGGGVAVRWVLNMENCIVSNNLSNGGGVQGGIVKGYGYGGGLWVKDTMNISNSIISYNTVAGYNGRVAGGVYCSTTDPSSIVNSTIAYNSHEGIYAKLDTLFVRNSISYFNASSQVAGKIHVTYSDIQDGYTGVGNINFNPVFQSSTDLIIVPGSPCIDAGEDISQFNDECFPPSLGGSRNDMGAHGGPNACGWLDVVTPVVSITATVTNTSGQNVNDGAITINISGGSPPYFFSWEGPDGYTSNNQNIDNLFAGMYYLDYGYSNCMFVDSVLVSTTSAVTENGSANNISVFPNPAVDYLKLDLPPSMKISFIEIINIKGNLVKRQKIATNQNTIDVRDLSDGVYIIRVHTDKGITMKKLIKE